MILLHVLLQKDLRAFDGHVLKVRFCSHRFLRSRWRTRLSMFRIAYRLAPGGDGSGRFPCGDFQQPRTGQERSRATSSEPGDYPKFMRTILVLAGNCFLMIEKITYWLSAAKTAVNLLTLILQCLLILEKRLSHAKRKPKNVRMS